MTVGSFPANAWGLYDMHGNVWEFCSDWYGAYLEESVTDPKGPERGRYRVIRGGSWSNAPDIWYCRSAYRHRYEPDTRYDTIGFRVAVDVVPDE